MDNKIYVTPENCDFTKIESNNLENECSPKLADPFFSAYEGILINGPKEVIWPNQASLPVYFPKLVGQTQGPLRLMLAGLIRAKYSTLGLRGQFSYHIVVMATDQKTGEIYSGKMSRGDFAPWPNQDSTKLANAPKREDFDEYSDSLHSSKFNLDLVRDLGLPITDATYSVYATLDEYKSNELVIKIKVQ